MAIFGISYFFALRIVGTFFTLAFRTLTVTQITLVLSLLAGLTIVCFFIYFHNDYIGENQGLLKKVTVWVIIGSCAMLIVHAKNLLLVLNIHKFPFLTTAHYVELIIPWVNSILILLFFIIFYKEIYHKEQLRLRKAILLAIIGSSIQTLLLTFIVFNYSLSGKMMSIVDFSRTLWIIFIPVLVFSFGATFYFFLTFYRLQRSST